MRFFLPGIHAIWSKVRRFSQDLSGKKHLLKFYILHIYRYVTYKHPPIVLSSTCICIQQLILKQSRFQKQPTLLHTFTSYHQPSEKVIISFNTPCTLCIPQCLPQCDLVQTSCLVLCISPRLGGVSLWGLSSQHDVDLLLHPVLVVGDIGLGVFLEY